MKLKNERKYITVSVLVEITLRHALVSHFKSGNIRCATGGRLTAWAPAYKSFTVRAGGGTLPWMIRGRFGCRLRLRGDKLRWMWLRFIIDPSRGRSQYEGGAAIGNTMYLFCMSSSESTSSFVGYNCSFCDIRAIAWLCMRNRHPARLREIYGFLNSDDWTMPPLCLGISKGTPFLDVVLNVIFCTIWWKNEKVLTMCKGIILVAVC